MLGIPVRLRFAASIVTVLAAVSTPLRAALAASGQAQGAPIVVFDQAVASPLSLGGIIDVAASAGGGFSALYDVDDFRQPFNVEAIYLRAYNAAGVPAGDAQRVDSVGANTSAFAIDAAGRTVVVWSEANGTTPGRGFAFAVKGRLFDASGRPRGAEFVITASGGPALSVAMAANGDFAVAWASAPLLTGFQTQFFDADGHAKAKPVFTLASLAGDQSPAPLPSPFPCFSAILTTSSVSAPSLALSPSGDALLAWSTSISADPPPCVPALRSVGVLNVKARRFSADGSAQGASTTVARLTDGSPRVFGAFRNVHAAMTADGNSVVGFSAQVRPAGGSSTNKLWFQRLDAAGATSGARFDSGLDVFEALFSQDTAGDLAVLVDVGSSLRYNRSFAQLGLIGPSPIINPAAVSSFPSGDFLVAGRVNPAGGSGQTPQLTVQRFVGP